MTQERRSSPPCASCGPSPDAHAILKAGFWSENPIAGQVLGICSALAVTNRVENALVMGAAVIVVTMLSNVFVSFLRRRTPRRIRMIAEVAIIATFVTVFDLVLKAYYPAMSRSLGPYVGLIITNCIVMGRAEAFAMSHRPGAAVIDGLANGLGYAVVLAVIALARELLGTGALHWGDATLFTVKGYPPNLLMVLAPGAFFALAALVAAVKALQKTGGEDET